MNDQLPKFEALTGEQLSSVIFVADYVQFDFNGPILTAISNPIARLRSGALRFPDKGSRDALCSLIHQYVAAAVVEESKRIEVAFDSGDSLVIPLDSASYEGPEAATFGDPRKGGLLVW